MRPAPQEEHCEWNPDVPRPAPAGADKESIPAVPSANLSPFVRGRPLQYSRAMDAPDSEFIAQVLQGDVSAFEPLVQKYQPRVFATARRYARRESEVEDIVQEVFIKAFQKLSSYRADAPFEHWLMRVAVRTCYDFLRKHQRNRESALAEITDEEERWLDSVASSPAETPEDGDAAKALVDRLLSSLPLADRMVITLLDIEQKTVKEIAKLTGWSVSLVKVRAFRARAKMRKALESISQEKYL